MKTKKIKNPLIKRIPKELKGDWKKYLVVCLFLVLTIGFVSGMYVANESMLTSVSENKIKGKLEDGHFELKQAASQDLITAIETGNKADIKSYLETKAKKEFDEKFDEEYKKEFDQKFNEQFESEFKTNFDQNFKTQFDQQFELMFKTTFDQQFASSFGEQFSSQVKQALMASGLDEKTASTMLASQVTQAKQDGSYQKAYDQAYQSAYQEAFTKAKQENYDSAYASAYTEAYTSSHDEAYKTAYDEAFNSGYQEAYDQAWKKVQDEINDKYNEAIDKYELDDPDFKVNAVTVYENFFKNASESRDDQSSIGNIRVYKQTDDINLACLMDGTFPTKANEIVIDRMHADNANLKVGDTIYVGDQDYTIVGLISYVNYATLHEKTTDLMFDAIKFDVAMVSDAGFDRLNQNVHYSYAWKYNTSPVDESEEKAMSDDFMKAMLTQVVVSDQELEDYVPNYANPAIHFATDDIGSDKAMGGVLLDILIVIIAFIFGVTISNTIAKEASTIGTLRALGYTKKELVKHYLSMPVIVTFVSAIIGNLLGYTVCKDVVVSMYYNSYSLPPYTTIWNMDAFIKTTLIPVFLMFVVNLIVIVRMMKHTPLQFLRHDLKKKEKEKARRLPNVKFFSRFRMRIMLQNISNYCILFVGIFFVMVMLAMAIGMPDTLSYYKKNTKDMMLANYQYVLASYEDEDGHAITTSNDQAEKFDMNSLIRKSDELDEEISVYGIEDDSQYVKIDDLNTLKDNEVYISKSYSEKYGVKIGDTISLDEKYDHMTYDFKVVGLYDKSLSLSVLMPIENYSTTFDLKENEFTGYLSNEEITDIDQDQIATVITEHDITKMADQLDHSMGSYMSYFQVLCILLSAVLIYLLTKLIIEKNENAISMTKILGYENKEIASLYIASTAIFVIFADLISVVLGSVVMKLVWHVMLYQYNGWFTFYTAPIGYFKMFSFVMLGYIIVTFFDFNRIKKIPYDQALKNVE